MTKYLTNRQAAQALLDGKALLSRGLPATGGMINLTKLDGASEYTLAPEVITRSITHPKPVSEPLEMGRKYWTASLTRSGLPTSFTWNGDIDDVWCLKNGLIHLTESDAIAHAKALIGGEG